MDDNLVKELMTTVNCSVCGRRYEAGDVNILYHQRELWFMSVSCQSCRTKGLVAALIKGGEKARFVTDLTEKDMARLKEAPPVNADDVLDVHNFLEGFDGDFSSLFTD